MYKKTDFCYNDWIFVNKFIFNWFKMRKAIKAIEKMYRYCNM